MYKSLIPILLGLFSTLGFSNASAQTRNSALPAVTVLDLNNTSVRTDTLAAHNGPTIVSFWALWCKPCIQELAALADEYADLQAETGVRLVAISIDDARNAPKVKSFVNGKGWEFEVFLDQNSDFKRAMNVNNVPHTFVLDRSGKVAKQSTQYLPGDEEALMELVRKLAASK
jgi:thiol-disulfide isomerase/thioredoxin